MGFPTKDGRTLTPLIEGWRSEKSTRKSLLAFTAQILRQAAVRPISHWILHNAQDFIAKGIFRGQVRVIAAQRKMDKTESVNHFHMTLLLPVLGMKNVTITGYRHADTLPGTIPIDLTLTPTP